MQFCVFFVYLKFGHVNFVYQSGTRKGTNIFFNGPANLRKFHRRKRDKSCSKDFYFLRRKTLRKGKDLRQVLHLSMRKLSNLSRSVAFDSFSHDVFLSIDLIIRCRRPINITGAVARNPRFHHIKTVLCLTVFDMRFQITVVRSYRATMFVLYADTFIARAMFAPRSRAVKKTLWSLLKNPPSTSYE